MCPLAGIAGFFLVPLMGGLVVRQTVRPTDTVKDVAVRGALIHAAIATAAGFASKRLDAKASDFAAGAMWGSGVGAASLAALPALNPELAKEPTLPRSAIAGLGDKGGLKTVVRLLTGAAGA